MAGFFGLFKSKTKYVDESDTESENKPKSQANTEDFYLKPDDAKSLGDIDFMRKPIRIKRTFAKVRGQETPELVQDISSVEKTLTGQGASPTPTAKYQPGQSAPPAPETSKRSSSDSSMDMFRNMAKDLKKK